MRPLQVIVLGRFSYSQLLKNISLNSRALTYLYIGLHIIKTELVNITNHNICSAACI